ncbi:hypothetical protein J1N35_010619 [Gossypium stocksii]|uniref:Uncharacterized protein n=1 Tax=Gossypium stocksii TaxID=47602 RepID=A0A9D3W0D5_9ROSI|nr:hypothetical protein J1N35_010619 [Gossypium stocksii]
MSFDDKIYEEGVYEEWEIMENQELLMIEISQRRNEASTHQWNDNQGTDIVEQPYEFTGNLYEVLGEDHDMSKRLSKPLYDLCEMPSHETTRTNNSKVLSNMSDMMAEMIKMMQEISEAWPPKKEDMSDADNLDHKNPGIIDDHDEIYESVEEPIHFLAIAKKVPTNEVKEFDSFSFDNGSKARVTKASCNRKRRKLESIIP